MEKKGEGGARVREREKERERERATTATTPYIPTLHYILTHTYMPTLPPRTYQPIPPPYIACLACPCARAQ